MFMVKSANLSTDSPYKCSPFSTKVFRLYVSGILIKGLKTIHSFQISSNLAFKDFSDCFKCSNQKMIDKKVSK